GIDEKRLENLFRIDSKVSKNGTDNERGSGLGLILCKEFVEKQGGKIWATSELGKGSRLTFTILTSPPNSF
ncbi:MAG: histidine kinase, partial [Leptospiraceae bacterium]|nr:histidine kinase [Leptospiraceae bacterium]